MTPRVVNKRTATIEELAHGVYVGRPTVWGNPFRIGVNAADRTEAIARYRSMVLSMPERVDRIRRELRGKHLICWCAPAPCHADVLLEIANGKR